MPPSVTLLGPHRAGKTTVGKLLAGQLGLPLVHLDSVALDYGKEIGYSEEAATEARHKGWEGYYEFSQPFAAHALARAVAELDGCILEVDSLQGTFADPELLARVRLALEPCPEVVLLLACPDLEEALQRIEERQQVRVNGMEINEHFVRHRSNHELAKRSVYTKGKTTAETCAEIAALIDPTDPVIILIGPAGAGKSTQGELLARRLNRPQVPMDERRWEYYREIGWNEETNRRIRAEEGFAGVYRYWKPFELHAVERLLSEHREGVIDFGAGHSVYEDETQLARARELLAPYRNVILLLPSANLDESAAIFRERDRAMIHGMDLNRFITTHLLKLARRVVYTEGQIPEETSREVLAGISPDVPP
jgi:shikimate kinase